MRDEFLRVDYSGFLPGSKLQTKTYLVAERIQSKAPSDSFIQLHVHKSGPGDFQCTARVQSSKVRFVVDMQDSSPEKSLRKVEDEVIMEINSWKSQRLFTPLSEPDFGKAV